MAYGPRFPIFLLNGLYICILVFGGCIVLGNGIRKSSSKT